MKCMLFEFTQFLLPDCLGYGATTCHGALPSSHLPHRLSFPATCLAELLHSADEIPPLLPIIPLHSHQRLLLQARGELDQPVYF